MGILCTFVTPMPMEDFIVSARKYRPKTFETVVGQENITQTLLKAIENNHLAQAFLFCGPRGVGKTSCARILARTVNQFHADSEAPEDDYAFNIFELDAASNNSVDDIRNLIDQTRIPPQIGKYKVYIIDEVHMLSTNAFNAFLKTLEEPPPYAIFILATTEKHKVLPTILSRCQVFDFNRIQIADIVAHLSEIAQNEGIEVESDALHIIAEKADGALRDALSIFDQIVGFTGNKMTYQDVISNLNILDYDYYFDMTDAFIRADKTEVLLTLNTILNNGFDGHVFINGLATHFRNLLFCTSERTASIMEVGTNIQKRYFEQAQNCSTRFILNAMHRLSEADIHYKASKNQRLLIELSLLQISALAEKLSEKKNAEPNVVSGAGSVETAPADTQPTKGNTSSSARTETKAPAEIDDPDSAKTKTTEAKSDALEEENPEYINNAKPAKNIESETEEESKRDLAGETESMDSGAKATPDDSTATPPENETTEGVPKKKVSPEKSSPEEIKGAADTPITTTKPKRGFSSKLRSAKSKGLPSLSSLAESSDPAKAGLRESDEDMDGENPTADLHENRPADEFTLARLWEVWKEYTEIIKEENKKSYYATLTKHQPVMVDKFKIELLIDNHVQQADLEADKARLLEFLREKLNNWQVQLKGVIDEEEKQDGDSLYDPRAKFEAMNKANPMLKKLKDTFDLDVEHDG